MSSAESRRITQTALFRRKVKRLRPTEKETLDQEIQKIFSNPEIGQKKRGNLRGVWVHKYHAPQKQMLLAYAFNDQKILLINLGSHENYYRELKNYLI